MALSDRRTGHREQGGDRHRGTQLIGRHRDGGRDLDHRGRSIGQCNDRVTDLRRIDREDQAPCRPLFCQ